MLFNLTVSSRSQFLVCLLGQSICVLCVQVLLKVWFFLQWCRSDGPVMIYIYSIELLVPEILTELNIYVAPAFNSIPAWSRDWWGCEWDLSFALRHLHRTVMQDYIEIDAHLLCEHNLPISHRLGCSVMLVKINRLRNLVQSPRHLVPLSFQIQEHLSPELNWRSQTWWMCFLKAFSIA